MRDYGNKKAWGCRRDFSPGQKGQFTAAERRGGYAGCATGLDARSVATAAHTSAAAFEPYEAKMNTSLWSAYCRQRALAALEQAATLAKLAVDATNTTGGDDLIALASRFCQLGREWSELSDEFARLAPEIQA